MSSLQKEAVEVPCLGRPFQLGMLYDMRRDCLIPGLSLWDNNKLQKHKNVIPKHFTQMEVSTSDSLEDKAASMNISGSLKLSVLSGKVNVAGSAKYFNDNKKSTKQSRITLKYHVSTHFEHLTMDHLEHKSFQYTEVFDSDLGTHVVTAGLYSADAFLVFNRDLDSNEEKTEVEGTFKAALSNLGKLGNLEGQASVKLNESEKAVTDKFSCTFYTDFRLPANPFSFKGAMDIYKQLPNMLGEKGENTVPLKAWLYPLAKLDSKAAKCVRDISNSLITAVSDVIESLNNAEIRCNDLAVDTAAQAFPAFHQKIQELKKKCNDYKLDLLKKVGSLLPLIRGGQEEECDLVDLLKHHEESPFSSTELDQWIKIKQDEADVLKAFLEKLECPVRDVYKSIGKVFAHTEDVVCFTFTSLDESDPFLDYLTNYIDEKSEKRHKGKREKPESWLTQDVGQRMRKTLKLFNGLKSSSKSNNTKFIVVSDYNEENPGACIMLYGHECDDTVCFIPPSKPICSTTDACDLTLDPNTAHTCLSLSEGNRKVTGVEEHQPYPDHPERFDYYEQVVCRESLTGRCYWEAEWSGEAVISVTYKGISRKRHIGGCVFGCNIKSWSLECSRNSYYISHNNNYTNIYAPSSSKRVGVYLDWTAGTLSFYRVSSHTHTLTHLHTFHSTFTEPLYAGFAMCLYHWTITMIFP
uniref:B30.2/SPRY domain-containing protein n=1 Tax=Electrophorus electricus TaxID=8005 RepID=A0AAY5E8I6_ELEEL